MKKERASNRVASTRVLFKLPPSSFILPPLLMKLHVRIENLIDETFEATDANDALHRVKREAAQRAPFLQRAVINAMSDNAFAAEAVKRVNAHNGRSDAIPQSAQGFLDWAMERGYVTLED